MPDYGWKQGAGTFPMKRENEAEVKPITIQQPISPTSAAGGPVTFCQACDPERPFPKAMIMAAHFNKTHKDLRLKKESWREYARRSE